MRNKGRYVEGPKSKIFNLLEFNKNSPKLINLNDHNKLNT